MSHATDAIHRHASARATVASPLGPLLLIRTQLGLAGVWFDGQQHHPGLVGVPEQPQDALLSATATHLQRYFDGEPVVAFDGMLDLHGTPFQREVWHALLEIAPGSTCSYGDIARRIGAPQAVRAVGAAIGRNPVAVIVPCHRVVGSKGALTGYAGGLDRKRALLQIERASSAQRTLRAATA